MFTVTLLIIAKKLETTQMPFNVGWTCYCGTFTYRNPTSKMEQIPDRHDNMDKSRTVC